MKLGGAAALSHGCADENGQKAFIEASKPPRSQIEGSSVTGSDSSGEGRTATLSLDEDQVLAAASEALAAESTSRYDQHLMCASNGSRE